MYNIHIIYHGTLYNTRGGSPSSICAGNLYGCNRMDILHHQKQKKVIFSYKSYFFKAPHFALPRCTLVECNNNHVVREPCCIYLPDRRYSNDFRYTRVGDCEKRISFLTSLGLSEIDHLLLL